MSVKEKALNQALILLRAIGAQFAIIVDGQQHGDLQVVKPKRGGGERQRNAPAYRWHDIYNPWLETAKPGSCFVHLCDSHEQAESLRGSISSRVVRKFGHGSVMTTITPVDDKFKVEALVISDNTKMLSETDSQQA